jgi:hypothetical protein
MQEFKFFLTKEKQTFKLSQLCYSDQKKKHPPHLRTIDAYISEEKMQELRAGPPLPSKQQLRLLYSHHLCSDICYQSVLASRKRLESTRNFLRNKRLVDERGEDGENARQTIESPSQRGEQDSTQDCPLLNQTMSWRP